MSAAQRLAPGLWRLRLPFHLELNHVNSFLIRSAEGVALVDCGYGTDEALEVLGAAVRHAGFGWRDIDRLVVTHTHPDHVGNAARVVELTGAEVLMHAGAAASLERFTKLVRQPAMANPWLASWGVAGETLEAMARMFADMSRTYQPVAPSRCVEDGEKLWGWTAIATPGHAPGHLCLLDADRRLLISGDHVLEAITPNIAWSDRADTLAEYLDSLEKVADLAVDTVIPSHGDPFEGLGPRCRQLAAHHEARCGNILAAIDGSATAQLIVERLWRRVLSPFQHRFALFEVMAHLKYMEGRGGVACDRSGPVELWRELPDADPRTS